MNQKSAKNPLTPLTIHKNPMAPIKKLIYKISPMNVELERILAENVVSQLNINVIDNTLKWIVRNLSTN